MLTFRMVIERSRPLLFEHEAVMATDLKRGEFDTLAGFFDFSPREVVLAAAPVEGGKQSDQYQLTMVFRGDDGDESPPIALGMVVKNKNDWMFEAVGREAELAGDVAVLHPIGPGEEEMYVYGVRLGPEGATRVNFDGDRTPVVKLDPRTGALTLDTIDLEPKVYPWDP